MSATARWPALPLGNTRKRVAICRVSRATMAGCGEPRGPVQVLYQSTLCKLVSQKSMFVWERCDFDGGFHVRWRPATRPVQPDAAASSLSRSATLISSNTPAQSPGCVCRNSRIVGYHGLSLRSSSQRQSGTNGSATHTGTVSPAVQVRREAKLMIMNPIRNALILL